MQCGMRASFTLTVSFASSFFIIYTQVFIKSNKLRFYWKVLFLQIGKLEINICIQIKAASCNNLATIQHNHHILSSHLLDLNLFLLECLIHFCASISCSDNILKPQVPAGALWFLHTLHYITCFRPTGHSLFIFTHLFFTRLHLNSVSYSAFLFVFPFLPQHIPKQNLQVLMKIVMRSRTMARRKTRTSRL